MSTAPVINSSALRFAVEPVIMDYFDGGYNALPTEYSRIFTVKTGMRRRFYDLTRIMGLGLAVEKTEGGPISYDTTTELWRTRVLYRRWALAFAITQDTIDDAEVIPVAQTMGEHLGRSMRETKEIVHADVFNRATNTSYLLGDGKPLLATDHPLGGGGTFSNYMAGVDLSDFALKQALIMIRTAPDERGFKIALKAKRLIVPPDNEFAAIEILKSEKVSGTANNNINSLRTSGRIMDPDPFVLTRLTSARSWFLQTDAPSGLLSITHPKGGMKKGMEPDFETDNIRYKASERYAVVPDDPRAVYGSLGT